MGANEIHVGDVGTVFRATVKDGEDVVDISAASVLEIIFNRPHGRSMVKTGVFPGGGDGSDGQLQYVSALGDLDVAGVWEWQLRLGWVSGDVWSTDVAPFEVFGNI